MTAALGLLLALGLVGAFDTLYYHEWRARLPGRPDETAPELYIHSARALLYAVLFGTLPWLAWGGGWLVVLAVVIVAEILLTFWDFVAERTVRRSLGDLFAGERVTHGLMGILYGAMIACLFPTLLEWWTLPTALTFAPGPVPPAVRWTLTVLALGVFLSGLRDLYAARALPGGRWPW